jgi:hypothetical protein
MSELIGRIAKLLDLGKLAALTAPGILMAIALLWLLQPPKPSDVLIPRNYQPIMSRPPECPKLGQLDLETKSKATDGTERREIQKALVDRKLSLDACLPALNREMRKRDAEIAALAVTIEPNEKLAASFLQQYEGYSKEANLLASQAWSKYESFHAKADGIREKSELLKKEKNELQTELELRTADLKDAAEKLLEPSRLRVETFGGFAARLSDHLLYVALVGILAGILLDPVNKAIFQFAYTGIEGLPKSSRPSQSLQKLRIFRMEIDVGCQLLKPNYAIGKGLITRDEFEALIGVRYRQAEICFGLIAPMLALVLAYLRQTEDVDFRGLGGAAAIMVLGLIAINVVWVGVSVRLSTEKGDAEPGAGGRRKPWMFVAVCVVLTVLLLLLDSQWSLFLREWGLYVLAFILGTVFYQGALRRYCKYRTEVQDLIRGRLKKLDEAQQAAKEAAAAQKPVDELVKTTATLTAKVDKLASETQESEGRIKSRVADLGRHFDVNQRSVESRLEGIERKLAGSRP